VARAARTPLFQERQRFVSERFGLVLVALGTAASIAGALRLILRRAAGEELAGGILLVAVAIGLPLLFWKAELKIDLWPDRLEIHFGPLVRRRIPLNELRSAHARRYRPLLEYGGWGVRHGLGGTAYNVRGNRGVQIALASGKSFLLGSQRSDELVRALADAVQVRYGRRLKGA